MPATAVKTVKSGQKYRVKSDGRCYLFMLTQEQDMVAIYTPTHSLGLYRIDRFGGALSPASIRAFWKK